MGLLDNLYLGHNANFGGQGGGLLDFLRTTQMQQDQYQPSAGFPGQAQPIDVDGYQMPRIGDQAQFAPPQQDPAALPPNAQPAQGQLPMQQPAQPQGFGGFLQGINENFQNMGSGGSIIGALTGQRPNNQTAQFLVSKGIDPAMAKTIVSDPGLMRSVLPQLLGTGKAEFGVIGKDEFGNEQYGWRDPKDKSITPYRPQTAAPAQPSAIPAPPAGVDPKIWRDEQSKRVVSDKMPADTKTTSALRNEVQGLPSYKNIAQAAPVYKSMLEAAGRDTRAADVNLIYGMAKIMDPGSVVRESEMTVAQAVATLPQQLRATIESQITSTGRLSPEVRAAIMQEAHGRMASYQAMFDQDAGMYRGIAQRGRMNEADVLPSFGPFDQYKPQPKPTEPVVIDGYKIKAR